MARKRKQAAHHDESPSKRLRFACSSSGQTTHPVLEACYPNVSSLKDFLCEQQGDASTPLHALVGKRFLSNAGKSSHLQNLPLQNRVYTLLHQTLVGYSHQTVQQSCEDVLQDLQKFSQQLLTSSGCKSADSQSSQAEIVDFAIWFLFTKKYPFVSKPPHILCRGFARASTAWQKGVKTCPTSKIPGICYMQTNEYVESLKNEEWTELLKLLGKAGEAIMLNLILNCGLFRSMAGSCDNLHQLSGVPLPQLEHNAMPSIFTGSGRPSSGSEGRGSSATIYKAADIHFACNRILHAKAAMNEADKPVYGFRKTHILSQLPPVLDYWNTLKLLQHVFPRQFKLKNVFEPESRFRGKLDVVTSVPRRLRRHAFGLVRKLHHLHRTCAFGKILFHYCSSEISTHKICTSNLDPVTTNSIRFATPPVRVFVFIKNVMRLILPREFLGRGDTQTSNWNRLLVFIKNFIFARKYESFTLENTLRGLKLKDVQWLKPNGTGTGDKMAISDFHKRREIFSEWIFFVVDSLLIPLIRSHFHVTESTSHRNRLLYFRHDVWCQLTKPKLLQLKQSILEIVPHKIAYSILESRKFGYSELRMLPKDSGMRPITNLGKKCTFYRQGAAIIKQSVNSVMRPVFTVLNYEKARQSEKLGSAIFSVAEVFQRIKDFRDRLGKANNQHGPLYFVKVDVQACFDSLPQSHLICLMKDIFQAREYHIDKYTEVRIPDLAEGYQSKHPRRPQRNFYEVAYSDENQGFGNALLSARSEKRAQSVFINSTAPQAIQKSHVEELLSQHVEQNLILIGKKYYRQKHGIPQGSILSSLLCNFFYGDFERRYLTEVTGKHNLLIRLVDDFLFISPNRNDAEKFLKIMSNGNEYYGISLKFEKSLVNFDMAFDDDQTLKSTCQSLFPYCGLLIDTQTLNIRRDYKAKQGKEVSDSLTVELSKIPGQQFRRKMKNALKIQMQTMLLDTSYNSYDTVLRNIFFNMVDVATKFCQYVKALAKTKRPTLKTMISVITDIEGIAYSMMKSNRNRKRSAEYACSISRAAVERLTREAFSAAVQRNQTNFRELLAWLANDLGGCGNNQLVPRRLRRKLPEVAKDFKRQSYGSTSDENSHTEMS